MAKSRSKRRDERTTAPQRDQDQDTTDETLTTTGQAAAASGAGGSPMKMAGLVFGLPFVVLVVLGVLTNSCPGG